MIVAAICSIMYRYWLDYRLKNKDRRCKLKKYKIGVIPGDGTGPEVMAECVKVLKAASGKRV